MANETITTDFFQLHFPHIEKPQEGMNNQPGKYGIRMAFMQDGIVPSSIAQGATSNCGNIVDALNKVCMEEWGVDYANAPAVRQIQHPPKFKNGSEDWKKDDKGNLLIGDAHESSVGKWLVNAKNPVRPGLVDHTGTIELQPSDFYMGCWCRAELEISAFNNKQNGASILSIVVSNIQKCYAGENLSGSGQSNTATQAFAGKAVTNSDLPPAGVTGMGGVPQATPQMPGQATPQMPGQATPQMPGQATPQMPGQATPQMPGQATPQMPGQPPAPIQQAGPKYVMQPSAGGASREQLHSQGWTDDLLVQHGHMVIEQAAPSGPGAPPSLPGQAYLKPPGM